MPRLTAATSISQEKEKADRNRFFCVPAAHKGSQDRSGTDSDAPPPRRSHHQDEIRKWTPLHTAFTASVLAFLFTSGAAAGIGWGYALMPGPQRVEQSTACKPPSMQLSEPEVAALANPVFSPLVKTAGGGEELELLRASDDQAMPSTRGTCFDAMKEFAKQTEGANESLMYKAVTGLEGHILPKMYGLVPEMTIWSFWYDPEQCRSADSCNLPASIKLCSQTVWKNRGSFDYRVLHFDEVEDYVSMAELPLHWKLMHPVQMKEALMNALLARYGGVALDMSTILFTPLDTYWNHMVESNVTYRGYMYRVSGQSWGLPEASAPWFLMSRREGIFSTAVVDQVSRICAADVSPEFALGDHTLTPALAMFNYSLPWCSKDPLVTNKWACPELEHPWWSDEMPGPARNDRRILLEDPRQGPQLPFSFLDSFSFGTWKVSDKIPFKPELWQALEGTEADENLWVCKSPHDCWNNVFLRRFKRVAPSGLPPVALLNLFRGGGRLRLMDRQELLSDQDTYFYQWLKLAGLSGSELDSA